jgi:hypothetical protein
MVRILSSLVVFLATATVTLAQQAGEPIALTLSPAAPPAQVSKYRLLPAGRDLVPGNAAALYYRSLAVFADNRTLLEELNSGQWEKWLGMPLEELPLAEVANKLETFQRVFGELDQAARRRQCDWQLADRAEGFTLLLPEVQKSRQVAQVLMVRVRYHLARKQYAEAAQALGTGYALARHLGEGPTLIHVLVGAAIANLMSTRVEEWVSQPAAPNLYWAVTVLPRPFLDPGPAVDADDQTLERTWPGLAQLEDGPLTPKQVQEMQAEFRRIMREFGFKEPTALDLAAQMVQHAAAYPEARKVLLDGGFTAEQLDAMPPFQVVAVYCLREFHRTWDDYIHWTHVKDFVREPGYRRARDRTTVAVIRLERLVLNPTVVLSNQGFLGPPALDKVYAATARTERRFAALRCLEALRAHAAVHGGRLPASLKDVTEVPVPVDPTTDRPFEYEVHGDRAKLSAPLRDGDKTPPFERLSYDITLRR